MSPTCRRAAALQALLVLAVCDFTAAFSFSSPRCSPPLTCRACAQRPPEENRALDRREFGQTAAAGAAAAGIASVFPAPAVAAAKRDEPVQATDKNMNEVNAGKWVASHKGVKDRDLVVGLNGDPYWLIVKPAVEGVTPALEPYALRAECTHLGCIVGWRPAQNLFVCPCHGSEYSKQGVVKRGPAPRALDLAKITVDEKGKVLFSKWTDEDFRPASKVS